MNLAQIIDQTPFLRDLYPTEKADIISTSEKIIIPAHQTIYVQDARGEFIYFLASGEVDILTDTHHKTKLPGDSFGEEVYFGTRQYLATAIAKKDSEIYIIPKTSFKNLYRHTNSLSDSFFASFSELLIKEKLTKTPVQQPLLLYKTTSYTEIFGWLFTLLAPLAVFQILGLASITAESRLFLSFLSCSVSMWMFRLFPEFIPGVFLLMSTLMFGLAPTSVVLSGLSSETFVLIMSVFVISILITTSGLTHRVAIYLMNFASHSMLGLNLVIFLIGTILTPMVPSIASRCVLVTPVVSKMLHSLKINEKSFLSVQFAASAFFGCSIFANVILSSSLMNFVILGLLPVQEQDQFQWLGWLKAAGIYGITVAIGYFGFMLITMMLCEKRVTQKHRFAEQSHVLGRLRKEEIFAIIGMILLTAGLLTNSLHKIHPSLITLFIMFCTVGFGLISKNQFQREVDWPFLIFMAAAVSITATIKHLGMDAWIANFLKIITSTTHSPTLFLTYIGVITLITRIFLPIAPAIVLLSTTFIPLAANEGVNPWLVTFIILVAADMWFVPYQNSFYLMFEEAGLIDNRLFYDRHKFIIYNFFIGVIKIGAFYISIPYWKSLGLM
ncbi:MAG: anion permease [Candidatus Paracaedibacteraceae bacterium]|nr:anion permease [Candidatus Paracaedibacteraceae bacterium]